MTIFPYPQLKTLEGLFTWGTQLVQALNGWEKKSAGGGSSSGFSSGDLKCSAVAVDQDGWLVCDGRTLKRTVEKGLFQAIGTTYNTGGEAGDEFRIPNATGRVFIGGAAGYGGQDSITLTQANLPAVDLVSDSDTHKHDIDLGDHAHATVVTAHHHTAPDKGAGTGAGAGTPTMIGDTVVGVTVSPTHLTGTTTAPTTGSTRVALGGEGVPIPSIKTFSGRWMIKR